jgi:hypothetical protein
MQMAGAAEADGADFAIMKVKKPGRLRFLDGCALCAMLRKNMTNSACLGRMRRFDKQAIYEAPEDVDGEDASRRCGRGDLAGWRVMILSEHMLEGWLEGMC